MFRRAIILALVFFLMGMAVGARWFSRKPSREASSQTAFNHSGRPAANVSPDLAPPARFAALDAVKGLIPDPNATSTEKAARILREAALEDFQHTAQEFQARQKKAEQKFIQGQNDRSGEQQRIAAKELRELQAERAEKLMQIAAKSKAQIDAFEQFKGAAP